MRELTFTAHLLGLRDGWHDGDGRAPGRPVLERLEQAAGLLLADGGPVHAFPTFAGGAVAEQTCRRVHRSVQVDPQLHVSLTAVDGTAGASAACHLEETDDA